MRVASWYVTLALARVASADPDPCDTCDRITVAARGGIAAEYAVALPAAATSIVELEAGVWATPQIAITAVVGGARPTLTTPTNTGPLALPASIGRVGARFTYEHPVGLLLGFGFGTAALRIHDDTPHFFSDDQSGVYAELLAGATLARVGPIALQLEGTLAVGQATTVAGTLGVAYDPSMRPAPARTSPGALVVSVSVGIDNSVFVNSDATDAPRGYGPRIEGELGPASSGWRGVVSWNGFHAEYSDESDMHSADLDLIRIGARHVTKLGERSTIAFGGGVMISDWRDSVAADGGTTGHVYADLQLGVELVRAGPLALRATTTLDVFSLGASWTAGLGVASR